uniref:RHS repeat-associated core domain-containing protein n=1 Tax=Paracidovorax oryzae TaxID=862720 RepID=UPI001ADF075E
GRQDWARQVRENLHDADFDLLRAGDGPGEGAGPVTRWPGNRIGWSTPEPDVDGAGSDGSDGNSNGTLVRYRYDAFGNRVQALHADGRAQRLRYDALHRLREVWQREAGTAGWQRVACYRYDPFGRRLAKTVFGHGNDNDNGDSSERGAASGVATTTYAGWDGDRLVHNEGPQGLQHVLYEPGSFAPLLRLEREQAIPTAMQALLVMEEDRGSVADDDPDGGESPAAALFAGLPRAQRELLERALDDATGPQGDALLARLQAGLPDEAGALLVAGVQSVRRQQQTATQAHSTRIRHFLCDHLGTPIALVDANGPQAGLVTWAATYHAWGAMREEYDPHGVGQPIRFQGQQLDAETGLHYNRFRYYDPLLGQYVTQDPIGLLGGLNKFTYPGNPISWIDPLGLSGILTIQSSGNGNPLSGHSWITYAPDGGYPTTYGTWGNNPTGQGNGLFENLEIGRNADATRSMRINDEQEKELMAKIKDYKNRKENAWKLGAPCSSFARDAWQTATGENLNSNLGPISNPSTLKNSIINANGGKISEVATKPNGTSSASFGSFGRSSGSVSLNSLGSSL